MTDKVTNIRKKQDTSGNNQNKGVEPVLPQTVMLMVDSKVYVGKPTWQEVYDEVSGQPTGDMAVIAVNDAWEFITMPIPKMVGGQQGIAIDLFCWKVGTIIDVPIDGTIAELASDSPYYETYVEKTTGIQKVGA